jgi:four helix bundle protein
MSMQSYKDMLVWQEARALKQDVYNLTYQFPKSELYAMSSQLRRAVTSIGLNIAEGAGRGTVRDYIHFLYNARGSCYEVETALLYAVDLQFITEKDLTPILRKNAKVAWLINKLIDGLEKKMNIDDKKKIIRDGIEMYDGEG